MAIRIVVNAETDEVITEEIEFTVNLDEIKKMLIEQVRAEARQIILAKWPEYKQRNAALGLLSPTEVDQMKADIQAVVDECNRVEAEILAAQDLATLQAIKPNWSQI